MGHMRAGRPGWVPYKATTSEVPRLNTLNTAPWQRMFASSVFHQESSLSIQGVAGLG